MTKSIKIEYRTILETANAERLIGVVEPAPKAKTIKTMIEKGWIVPTRQDADGLQHEGKSFLLTNNGFIAIDRPVPEGSEDPAARFAKAGVMTKSYHDRYMAQGGGCADTIDMAMKDAFLTLSRSVPTKTGTRSEPALDVVAMREWGVAIGLWNDKWDRLNPGMQRMNLTNRVRSAVRKGADIKVKLRNGERKGKTIRLAA